MVEETTRADSEGVLGFITRRPIAITMLVVATAVFGIVSFSKLSVDLLPEISYPTLTVRTTWPGAAPEDVEERVSERLQEALSTLPNLVRTSSISRAGTSDVLLDFDWGTTMAFAVQDVREKLDTVLLPRGAERPLILRYDPNLDPILRIGVTSARGHGGESELVAVRWLAENRVKRELEAIAGVAAVQIRGGMEEEIHVRVDPFKLAARQIDPAVLSNRLAQENINASGGSLLEGSTEYLVRTLNEFRTVEEIEDLAVVERGDALIRVRDLAEVRRTHKKREVVSRLGGGEMVELSVYREAGANIVQLAAEVKDLVLGSETEQKAAKAIADREESGGGGVRFDEQEQTDFLAHRMRKDLEFELLSDQSIFIEDAIDDVKSSGVVGAVLAVLVLWLFLRRLAPTLIIGAVIPISVVVTFAPMFMFGVNLNIMSLGGLALGIGNLVDNAIVLLESITRCRDEGDSIRRAAVRGTREVIGAVTSSTLTTVVAFAPIVFVSGIAGQIFGDQALTVVTSQIVSLLVAILLIPMLVSRPWLGGVARSDPPPRPERMLSEVRWSFARGVPNVLLVAGRSFLFVAGFVVRVGAIVLGFTVALASKVLAPAARAFDSIWNAAERAYVRMLSGSLRHPFLVLGTSLALFVVAALRVPSLGVELLPEMHQGEFTAFVGLPIGTPLAFTDRVMHEIDRDVRALPGVKTTALTVGIEPDALSRDVEGPHTARLLVRLQPEVSGPGKEDGIVASVRELVALHPAVQSVEIRRPTPFALEAPIAVEVKGYDLVVIEGLANEVHARLARLDGLEDLRTSARPGHPEALIRFDRDKTLEYGLDLAAVSNLVRDQVLGNVSTRFNEGEERIDVRVIGDDVVLSTLESVLDLVVNPGSATPVPLRAVAEVFTVQGPAEIRRIGNTRGVVVTAESTGLDLGGVQERIEASLASLEAPADVVVELGGQKREMDEAQTSMRFALALAVFLVYVVMASQFESLIQPFVILLTVPLAAVGVVFALDLFAVPVSVVVFLGLIILAGIVVNNAIVLIDRINQKRAEGSSLRDAILDAGHTRLRPILMTTATTVFGLLPMTGWLAAIPKVGTLGSGEGAELRAPMAITVVAGLTFATVLTLVVIPTVYALVARWDRRGSSAA